ncbi:histone deacetylase family protein [Aquariibacter albus]|uniref:Histone deacetylase family protein n=1 Tax=Aquariibacter albus TaxID=2759899 RepID=A0A839HFT8_9BURK|nr:histone deacetylase family protein [Aquariibacter albus]MBB1160987.1 histone deacetylase family protein [Aquariibacter albus]
MATAYFTHPDCRKHVQSPDHPESPQRLDAIADLLIATGLDALLDLHEAPLATEAQLARAHTALHVATMRDLCAEIDRSGQSRSLDPDTRAGPGTWQAALRAAGAAVAATDLVLSGGAENAFCAVRPPGHHAEKDQAMGFCLFNNVAVAVRHALDVHGLKRVAVVDFDVHHGNGTEDILAHDMRTVMVGFFQHPLYPGSGDVPKGPNMLNLPVPPYTKGPAIRDLFTTRLIPRLDAFKPELLVLSAGFDAHRDDDLAQLMLVEDDYAWITRELKACAQRHARGRIVSCLEGGYNLGALARSVLAHLRVLAGVDGGRTG